MFRWVCQGECVLDPGLDQHIRVEKVLKSRLHIYCWIINVSKLLERALKFSCMSNHYCDQIVPTKPCIAISIA